MRRFFTVGLITLTLQDEQGTASLIILIINGHQRISFVFFYQECTYVAADLPSAFLGFIRVRRN